MTPVLQSGNDLPQTAITRFCCQIRRSMSPVKDLLVIASRPEKLSIFSSMRNMEATEVRYTEIPEKTDRVLR